MLFRTKPFFILAAFCLFARLSTAADANVRIVDVPDYNWYAGCFGSASGNLMGFWDRNGLPNIYTGPTAGGVAPLNSFGDNNGIRSLWANRAGFDGRPLDKPGHIDDYWDFYFNESGMSYQSFSIDPYILAGRPEHAPDCTSDFMGSSQNKWTNLNGECNGNIDAFAFNFWDHSGARRFNFTPPDQDGLEVRDIQSGFRKFAEFRGYHAEGFSQLVDFNPTIPAGTGFTFEDVKAEINAGYPFMLYLQSVEMSRDFSGAAHMNPVVHGMIADGYYELEDGTKLIRYRTSWGEGDHFHPWDGTTWEVEGLTLRGVIGFRPKPQITTITNTADGVSVKWDGPSATLEDASAGAMIPAHWYVVEQASTLTPPDFSAVIDATTNREAALPPNRGKNAFYRVKLLDRQPTTPANP